MKSREEALVGRALTTTGMTIEDAKTANGDDALKKEAFAT
jgi:hypothetical protein